MTAISTPKEAAYKIQWDSVAQDIRDVTRLGTNVPLCLSYLFSRTIFRGIPEFVSYFQENEELYVPAGQRLSIWDVSLLDHEKEEPMAWKISKNPVGFILDTLLAPIGKASRSVFDVCGEMEQRIKVDQGFSVTRSIGYTLKAVQKDLDIRLSDLFRLMVVCKIPKLEFGPAQKVHIWGISSREQRDWNLRLNRFELLGKIMDSRVPAGCKLSLSNKNCQMLFEKRIHEKDACQSLTISADLLTIAIEEDFSFPSMAAFAKKLLQGEIEVLPHQKLTIRDKKIGAILGEYVNTNGIRDRLEFLLNQMLLPWGYTVEWEPISSESALGWSYKIVDEKILELVSTTGFALKAAKGDLLVNFKTLGSLMLHQCLSQWAIAPGQRVFVYGLSARELKEIGEIIARKDLMEIRKIPSMLLQSRVPLGFSWSLEMEKIQNVSLFELRWGVTGATLITLKLGASRFEIFLTRPTGEVFIQSIVNHSHPKLLTGLREFSPDAMQFLLFRAFFYFLCQNRGFRSDELPDFFRPIDKRPLVSNGQGRMQLEGEDPLVIVKGNRKVLQLKDGKKLPLMPDQQGRVRVQGKNPVIILENSRDIELFQVDDASTASKIARKVQDPHLSMVIGEINSSKEILARLQEIIQMSPQEFDELSLERLPAPLQIVLKEIRELSTPELRKSPFLIQHLKTFIEGLPADSSDTDLDRKERSMDKKR